MSEIGSGPKESMELAKSVTTIVCPKCGGRLVPEYDDASCLMCGFVQYSEIPNAEDLLRPDEQLPALLDEGSETGPYRRAA